MPQKGEQNKYEIMAIITPNLSEEETQEEIDKIKKTIKKIEGEIFHEDIWGKKDFAYPIKKHKEGFYVIYNFVLSNVKKLPELDETCRLNVNILRHLIIKTPFNYEIKDYTVVEEVIETKEAEEIEPKVEKVKKEVEIKKTDEIKKEEKHEEKKEPKKKTVKKIAKKIKEEPVENIPEDKKEEEKKEEPKKKDHLDALDKLDEELKKIIGDKDITL